MDAAPIARLRWRLRGAWMWPAFLLLTLADGIVLHQLPVAGDSTALLGALIFAFVVNLIAVVALAPALGVVIRRVRRDMPRLVARDYGGTLSVCLVTLVLLAAGLIHHRTVRSDSVALQSAAAFAQGYIGDHAPPTFVSNLRALNIYELEPPRIYRVCAPNLLRTRWYCVIVKQDPGFPVQDVHGNDTGFHVRYDGSEANQLLSQGTS